MFIVYAISKTNLWLSVIPTQVYSYHYGKEQVYKIFVNLQISDVISFFDQLLESVFYE